MKKIVLALSIVVLMIGLSGCCVNHTWIEATCETPKTCSICGKERGKKLRHTWNEATCEKAKTCRVCGETEGEKLGHAWIEATCEEAKTCRVCGKIEGRKRGHDWVEICGEPKVCNRCGKIETEKLGHDWIEAICVEPKTCSRCGKVEGDVLGHAYNEKGICNVCGVEDGIKITEENYKEYFDMELIEEMHLVDRSFYDSVILELKAKQKILIYDLEINGWLKAACRERGYKKKESLYVSSENLFKIYGYIFEAGQMVDEYKEEVLYTTYIGGPLPSYESIPIASYAFVPLTIRGRIKIVS